MFGLKIFHRQKPRGFNYIPRHYDPEQERRDERRLELLGPDAPSVKRRSKSTEKANGAEERKIRFHREITSTSRVRRQPAFTGLVGILGMLALLAVLCYLFIR